MPDIFSTTPLPESLYTEEQLDVLDAMEAKWKESFPNHTFAQLMETYPDAIPVARRGLLAHIKEYKKELVMVGEMQDRYYDVMITKLHFSRQAEEKTHSDGKYDELRKEIETKIKRAQYQLSHLDELEGKKEPRTTNGVSEADVARAKEVPISSIFAGNLRKQGKMAVGRCPFHNEKTASFFVYLKQNTWWCYGCNTGGSVVDYVMQQNRVDFLTAVKSLL